jgi:hypothetical protein
MTDILSMSMSTISPRSDHSRRAATASAASRPRVPRVFNPVTRQRFARDRWRGLVAHLGREPSYPEQIVISRVIALEWDLRRLDARLDAGDELSGHAARFRLAAENRLRLDLAALGLKSTAVDPGERLRAHNARILSGGAE